MNYACNYETLKNDNVEITKKYTDCFYSVYGKLKEYDFIKYYIIKDYTAIGNNQYDNPYSRDNHNTYSESDIIKYVNILNKLPNLIELDCNDKYYSNIDDNEKSVDAYSFKISTKNDVLCKIQLNCIRYLHECERWEDITFNDRRFIDIPKTLIKVNSKLKTLNILNKIILSHYISTSLDGGHDIVGKQYKTLFTKQKYLKFINDYKDSCFNVFNCLPKKSTFIKDNEQIKLKKLLSTDVKKAYVYYKNLLKSIK
jgi:hypothetical protein